MKYLERFNSYAAELLPVSEASKAFDMRQRGGRGGGRGGRRNLPDQRKIQIVSDIAEAVKRVYKPTDFIPKEQFGIGDPRSLTGDIQGTSKS